MEVSYWDHLNTFLAKALREPTRQLEQELYYRLEDAKPRFLALLDVPPRNSSEEAELKTGKATISGIQKTYNNDFVQVALFLAQQLECSERYAAGILDHVLSEDTVESALRAVQQFYASRQHVLATLQLILDSAMGMNPVEPAIRTRLVDYIISLCSTGTLAENILKQIDTSAALMQRQLANQRNAGSTTVIGTGFSSDLYAQVVSALRSERQQLGNLLFVLAGSGELRGAQVAKMVSWISTVSIDEPIMVYVLAACLAALDASSQLSSETALVGLIKSELAKPNWRIPEAKAVITIKWCLFLIEAANGDNRTTDVYSESEIEKLVTDSVRADAFRYLSLLLHSSRPLDATSQDTLQLEYDSLPPAAPVDGLFYKYLLRQVEIFLITFVTSLSPVLRRMRHADEDTTSLAASRSQAPPPTPHPSRLADFFTLIALVYSDQSPDEALKWWDDRLYAFLRWSAEARVPTLLKPLYNMFGSLARGQSCATYAYNFFSTNGGQRAGTGWCSWAGLFGSLDWLLSSVPDQRAVDSALGGRERQPLPVDPEEIRSIMAFLRVLRIVARYSTAARAAILESAQYRAVAVMLDLVRSHVALELKGKLFDTLAAFCEGPELGGEVAKLMWVSLERYEVLPVRSTTTTTAGGWKKSRGVPAELDEIEGPARTYPATLSFLHLLNALVPFPPDNLGSGHRVPGTGPYVKFVLDDVLVKVDAREYLDPSERWKMVDAALAFVQASLDGFDMGVLVGKSGGTHEAQKLVQHPGFGVLLRVLVDPTMRDVLFGILSISDTHLDSYYISSLVRTLRILSRTLDIQQAFIDLLVPAARALSLDVDIPSVLSPADQTLLWRPESVVHIAGLVNYRLSNEVVLLAVQLTTKLSQSSCFNSMETSALFPRRVSRLLGILGDVDVSGYVQGLKIEPGEEVGEEEGEDQVRDAMIDFLLVNTTTTAPSPNFAHLLLGFDVSLTTGGGAMPIQDPRAIGARENCLGVVLDMLGQGIPRLDRKKKQAQESQDPLFARHPVFAEKCYRLVHQLCTHSLTFGTTIRYLRTHDDFFARQLSVVSMRPPTAHDPDGAIRLADNSVVSTSCSALTAYLRLRSWVLDLVSLELHIMSGVEQDPRASRILSILFQKPASGTDHALTIFEEAMNVPAPGQGLMRVLELLESLAFQWTDAKSIDPVQLELFSDLNFDACLRPDPTGCYVVDAEALLTLLTQQKRYLQKQGFLPTPEHHTQLKTETRYLLECCALENNRRLIAHARAAAYESWTRLCNVALTRCFDALPDENREMIMFDVVQALPPVILSAAEPETAILLCETLLSLVAKLRDDRHHQVVLQSIVDDPVAATLPPERLNSLLAAIMDCVLQPGTTERQRGNLYSAMVHYIQLAFSAEERHSSRLAHTSSAGAVVMFGTSPTSKRPNLESSTLQVLNKFVDRLVPLVCRDAIDGSDVWKTIAFTFLESLVRVSRMEKPHRVLGIMARQGFLAHFVQSVAESEDQMLAVLKPDPESLNALYVYEAKMSLLIKIAQTRQGADRLQDARLLAVLAQCDFLNARPEKDVDFRNLESFLPSALERYHQILVPALEIATSVVSTIGSDSPNVAKQALHFILTHRETCLMLFTTEETYLPLASVRELHLFVSLCALVAPHVEAKDLSDARAFGQVHAAVLELASRILSQGGWRMNVVPVTESEMLDANRKAKGITHSKMSVFDRRAQEATDYLRKWILVYLSSISERSIGTNEPFYPVLTAVASTAREPAAIATGKPYLADAIAALKASVARLSSLLAELKDIPTQSRLGLDEVDEIVQAAQVSFLNDLDIPQRRALASRELAHAAEGYQSDVRSTLHTIEILLLLLWRHLQHFLSPNSSSVEDAGSFMRSVSAPMRRPAVLEHLRADAEVAIREITLELDEIQVPKDVLGATADAGARETYVHVLTRMLRTVTTLGGQDMDEEDD
ncbi:structural constituent of nuclear pore protein [Rhizoctonia solani 123E]|uniref:Structural constituent of nuclear pore protein n=1 Tax=Rhizoctonia solani 123E TaxID=1423351 RepID=A0A074SCW6_9AGAM|nr:structural constituent of nuclear pore protein [Rhizoctonia solani 123E]